MNVDQAEEEFLVDIMNKHMKEKSKLRAIKAIVDAYDSKAIDVTIGTDDFDYINHVYDLNVIIGIIKIHVYEGLNENIPRRKE